MKKTIEAILNSTKISGQEKSLKAAKGRLKASRLASIGDGEVVMGSRVLGMLNWIVRAQVV